jgi:hypothetical protein
LIELTRREAQSNQLDIVRELRVIVNGAFCVGGGRNAVREIELHG